MSSTLLDTITVEYGFHCRKQKNLYIIREYGTLIILSCIIYYSVVLLLLTGKSNTVLVF